MLSSPLSQHIHDYDPPRDFSIPPFAIYDGSSDSYDHMLHFNKAMILNIGDDRLLVPGQPQGLDFGLVPQASVRVNKLIR